MLRLFHYTALGHLPKILNDGFLKLTESNVHSNGAGPRAVWLTTQENPDQGWQRPEVVRADKGQIRFTLEVPKQLVHVWKPWARKQNSPGWWMKLLIKAGGGPAEAAHWHICTIPIPRSMWVKIEDTRFRHDYTNLRKLCDQNGNVLWEAKEETP